MAAASVQLQTKPEPEANSSQFSFAREVIKGLSAECPTLSADEDSDICSSVCARSPLFFFVPYAQGLFVVKKTNHRTIIAEAFIV